MLYHCTLYILCHFLGLPFPTICNLHTSIHAHKRDTKILQHSYYYSPEERMRKKYHKFLKYQKFFKEECLAKSFF